MHRRQAISSVSSFLGASALGFWPGASQAQSTGVSDTKIVLGQSAPFSGPAEQLGVQFFLGAQLYFDILNQAGGVSGRQIELRRLDDGYDPERCVANTRKFLDEGVFSLFGYVGTSTSLKALPMATAAKVPFFAPFTGEQALREPFNRYAFHIRASYLDETALIVRQLVAVGIKKIAVFYQNDDFGLAGLEGVKQAMKSAKLEPVAIGAVERNLAVERNSTDVDKSIESILASRPEAIVQISSYTSSAAFVRRARRKGFAGNFYNLSFVGTQALIDELGAEAKGVVISQVMPFPYTPATPIAGEYLKAVNAKRGIAPNYSGIEGFVAAKTFAEGMRRAGRGLTRETFIAAMDGLKNHNLGGFPVDFAADKRTGSNFVELTLVTEDGKVRR